MRLSFILVSAASIILWIEGVASLDLWDWNPWGPCSRTCGGGTRTRYSGPLHPRPPQTESCGETCLNNGHFYAGYCQCVPGTRDTCCDDIPECSSNPCQNGGTCVEMINKYQCTCTPGFIGVNCEKDLFSPHDSVCRSGDSCYVIFKIHETWQGAKEFCEARQGHLAVPETMAEDLFLENHLESMRVLYSETQFWIGGTKSRSSPPQWVSGIQSTVFRWPFGISEDATGCLIMDGNHGFRWQAIPCDRPSYFICEEKVPFQLFG